MTATDQHAQRLCRIFHRRRGSCLRRYSDPAMNKAQRTDTPTESEAIDLVPQAVEQYDDKRWRPLGRAI